MLREADKLEAVFFDWDENGVREISASQPPPMKKKPKKKKKKKKKKKAQKAAEVEAAQDIEFAAIKTELATAEPYVPENERKPAAVQAHVAGEGDGLGPLRCPGRHLRVHVRRGAQAHARGVCVARVREGAGVAARC